MVTRNRITKRGGGLAIYIKDKYSFSRKDELSEYVEGEFESLVVEVKTPKEVVLLSEVYRVPNTSEKMSLEHFSNLINKIKYAKYQNIIMSEEQNFDFMHIHEHQNTADLFNLFVSNLLVPTITRPTRVTHQSATLIDNIYASIKANDKVHSGIIRTDISDHPICETGINTNREQKIKRRKNCDIE